MSSELLSLFQLQGLCYGGGFVVVGVGVVDGCDDDAELSNLSSCRQTTVRSIIGR